MVGVQSRSSNFISADQIAITPRAYVSANKAGIINTNTSARYYPTESPHNPIPQHHTITINNEHMTPEGLISIIDQKITSLKQIENNPNLTKAVKNYLRILSDLKEQVNSEWVEKVRTTVLLHEENHALQHIRYPEMYQLIRNANDIPPTWHDPEKQRLSEKIEDIELSIQVLKEVQAFALQHISVKNPHSVQHQNLWISGYRVIEFLNNPTEVIDKYKNAQDSKEYTDAKYTLTQVILFSQSFKILDHLVGNEIDLTTFCNQLLERFLFLCNHPNELSKAVSTPQFIFDIDQELAHALVALKEHLSCLYPHKYQPS